MASEATRWYVAPVAQPLDADGSQSRARDERPHHLNAWELLWINWPIRRDERNDQRVLIGEPLIDAIQESLLDTSAPRR